MTTKPRTLTTRITTVLILAAALAGVAPADAADPVACVHHIANTGQLDCDMWGGRTAAIGLCPPGSHGIVQYDASGNAHPTCYSGSTCPGGTSGVGVSENGNDFNQCVQAAGPCDAYVATDSSLNAGDHYACVEVAKCSTGTGAGHGGVTIYGEIDGGFFQTTCLSPMGILESLVPPCPPGWLGHNDLACASLCPSGYGFRFYTGQAMGGLCADICGTPGQPGWAIAIGPGGSTPQCAIDGPWIAVQPSNVCPPNGQDDIVFGVGNNERFAVCL